MKRVFGIMLIFVLISVGFAFADRNLDYEFMNQTVVLLFNGRASSLESWIGSGVIISPDGYIVTNRHVAGYYVAEDKEDEYGNMQYKLAGKGADLLVYHEDWGYGGCRIVAVSVEPDLDLALLKIEPIEELPYAEIGVLDKIHPGLKVFAVGHPLGVGWSMTSGIISKVIPTTNYNELLLHDASINPGNSGGPLFDEFCRVIGLNYAGLPPYAAENMGLAISASSIGPFVILSMEFDRKRSFVMTENDYEDHKWNDRYFTFRFKK